MLLGTWRQVLITIASCKCHTNCTIGDPDDVISLLVLIGHPSVRLRAVTCYPGGQDQIGFIKYILAKLNMTIPVGMRLHLLSCLGADHWTQVDGQRLRLTNNIYPEG